MVPHTGTISRMRPRATAEFVCTSVSLPGLTGQSSIHGRWLLDRPVKPGDDSLEVAEPPLPELVTFGDPVPQTIEPHTDRNRPNAGATARNALC